MEPKLLEAKRFVDMRTGCSYRYVLSDTEYFRPHYHDYYEVFIMLNGSAVHCVNGERFLLHRGAVVFIRPRDVHDYICVDGKPFSMLNLTFTAETSEQLLSFLGDGFPGREMLSSEYPPEAELLDTDFSWLEAQMADIRAIDMSDVARLRTTLRIFLFRLMTRCFFNFEEDETDMPLWLSRLCLEMKKSGNYTLGAERMVELSGKSREHIARSLKKYTGMTISEFVNQLRLKFIANMLKNSNHSISDIVFESGFNNLSWAADRFKAAYGVSMSEFRAQGRQGG